MNGFPTTHTPDYKHTPDSLILKIRVILKILVQTITAKTHSPSRNTKTQYTSHPSSSHPNRQGLEDRAGSLGFLVSCRNARLTRHGCRRVGIWGPGSGRRLAN